jgi:hypothetical protein
MKALGQQTLPILLLEPDPRRDAYTASFEMRFGPRPAMLRKELV